MVGFSHTFGVDLKHLAVVGYESVDLALHVGGLGIYGSRETSLDKLLQLVGILDVSVCDLLNILEFGIAPVLVVLP